MSEAYLLVDIGSTYTKVTGVSLKGEYLGSAMAPTTVGTSVLDGVLAAVSKLEDGLGEVVWLKKIGASSAAGGLKMAAIGLVPELTLLAAKQAALSAGAKVGRTYAYKLSQEDMADLTAYEPDLCLLTGGTDGGNEEVILHNTKMLAASVMNCPIIYAGNKSSRAMAMAILEEAHKTVIGTTNVLPSLGTMATDPVTRVISELFIERIIKAKGLHEANKYLDQVLMPTPQAVLRAASLLSEGTKEEAGLGPLMVVDMGGATTDVHSVCDGLPNQSHVILKGLMEAKAKRTVEGDLGARISIRSLLEQVDESQVLDKSGLNHEELWRLIHLIEVSPDLLSTALPALSRLDEVSAAVAVHESVRRHAGSLTSHYTPLGQVYEQVGKDLSQVTKVIGTGGPIIYHKEAENLLMQVCYKPGDGMKLLPKNLEIFLDRDYILAAMGLLSTVDATLALKLMKTRIKPFKEALC